MATLEISGIKGFKGAELIVKTCYCNRDFTEADVTKIITELRKRDNIRLEQQYQVKDPIYITKDGTKVIKLGKEFYTLDRKTKITDANVITGIVKYKIEKNKFDDLGTTIFQSKKIEKIQTNDANLTTFTKELNAAFKKYEINTCIRKIHFLAQSYHESQRFQVSYESNPNATVIGGEHYRGRGLLQLTHDYNYEKFYKDLNSKKPSDKELFDFAPKVAKELHFAIYASAFYWKNIGSKRGNISQFADKDDVLTVSKEINGYVKTPYGYTERVLYTNQLKTIMTYDKCAIKK